MSAQTSARTAVDSTNFCSRLRLSVQRRTRCFDAFHATENFLPTMPLELNPEKTCLLFFDMLNGHVKKEDPDTKMRYSTVVPNAVALLNRARELNIMVAYAAANHRADDLTTAKVLRDTDNKMRPVAPGTSVTGAVRYRSR